MFEVQFDLFFEVAFGLSCTDLDCKHRKPAVRFALGIDDLMDDHDVGCANRLTKFIVENAVHVRHDRVGVASMVGEQSCQHTHDDGMDVVRHQSLHKFAAMKLPRAAVVTILVSAKLSSRGTAVA